MQQLHCSLSRAVARHAAAHLPIPRARARPREVAGFAEELAEVDDPACSGHPLEKPNRTDAANHKREKQLGGTQCGSVLLEPDAVDCIGNAREEDPDICEVLVRAETAPP